MSDVEIFDECTKPMAVHCDTLQHTATRWDTLQHAATHCNTLGHTATYSNTLQPKAAMLKAIILYV